MPKTDAQKCLDRLARARREIIKAMERFMEVDAAIGLRPGHIAEMRRRLQATSEEATKLITMLEGDMSDLKYTPVKDLKKGDRTPWYEVVQHPEQRADKAYKYQVLVSHFDTGVTDYVWAWGDEEVPVHDRAV